MARDYDNSYRDYYSTSTRKGGYRNSDTKGMFSGNLSTPILIVVIVLLYVLFSPFKTLVDSLFKGLKGLLNQDKGDDEKKEQALLTMQQEIDLHTLPHPKSYYQQIATSQFDAMNGWGTSDVEGMLNQVRDLSKYELWQVYVCFGNKTSTNANFLGLFGSKDNIIQWYKDDLTDSELEDMRQIWATSELPW